jgi:hypothetical protein
MDKEPKTHDLAPEKLARLWNIGSDACIGGGDETGDRDDRYAELLCDWMTRQLPPDPEETQQLLSLLPEALGELCQEVRPFSGDLIGSLLTQPDTDVRVLRRIKDYAKELGGSAAGPVEREAALAVYFAAIAAAQVFHDARISQYGDKKLQSAFEALSRRNAVPAGLRALFQRACRGKQEDEPDTLPRKGDRP